MTYEEFYAACLIAKWIGIGVALWFIMMFTDLFTCTSCPRFSRYFGPIVKWYSRLVMTTCAIIFTFLVLLLWETRSY